MYSWIAHGAPGGALHLNHSSEEPRLSREDQAALELGFSPSGGLSWRRRRVAQLRERIENGQYEIDSARVAESMLSRLGEAS